MSEDEELRRALQARPPPIARVPREAACTSTHTESKTLLYVQASLNVSGGGQDVDEESALRWAQEESLKACKDAVLPDLMLESELHRATQLSLRQSQLETERLRQQEAANEAELAKGVQASLQAATPSRSAPQPAKPESQQERRTLAGEPEYSSNYD